LFHSGVENTIGLFHALGKFAELKSLEADSPTFVNDIILYIVYEELDMITKHLVKTADSVEVPESHNHLVGTVLDLLIHDVFRLNTDHSDRKQQRLYWIHV
jgi:hypothetical protein